LTTVIGCNGNDWGFDLFGGDSVNEEEDNNNNNGGNGGDDNRLGLFVVSIPEDGISAEFPAAVFSAITGGTKSNQPVALFSSFDDGSDITELTGVINRSGTGDVFKVSPDGKWVAYLSEEKSEGDSETQISELPSDNADVTEFDWSPDSSRIAYLAEGKNNGSEVSGRFHRWRNAAVDKLKQVESDRAHGQAHQAHDTEVTEGVLLDGQ